MHTLYAHTGLKTGTADKSCICVVCTATFTVKKVEKCTSLVCYVPDDHGISSCAYLKVH